MDLRIGLNKTQVATCRRLLILWGGFVAFGLILGASLKPRPDEIAFMVLLPLPAIILYAVISLIAATLRVLLWPQRRQNWHRWKVPVVERPRLPQRHGRIRHRSG